MDRRTWWAIVAMLGFSCSAACGILVFRSGIEPVSPALQGRFFFFLQGRFLTTGSPGATQY